MCSRGRGRCDLKIPSRTAPKKFIRVQKLYATNGVATRIFGLKNVAFVLASTSFMAQARPRQASVIGSWHLVRIESPGSDGTPPDAAQPTGLLIYRRDGHAAVQSMYPQTSVSNEFFHDGYEATFGTYDLAKESTS